MRLDANELLPTVQRVQREQAELEPYHWGWPRSRRAGLGELYDTSVAFAGAPTDWEAVGGTVGSVRIRMLDEQDRDASGSTHYPLNLTAAPGRTLRLALSYQSGLFTREAVEQLATRLRTLLETFAATPHLTVGRIEMLTEDERTRTVRTWNDTSHPVPEATLPDLFEAQAARTPEGVAVVFGGEALTYAEFAARVDRLTAVLRAHGVGTGAFVAVAVPRSVELVVALHAVVAAGAAYVPVDPDYPAERIGCILQDAEPTLLLTTSALAGTLPAGPPCLLLDRPLPSGTPGTPDRTKRELHGAAPAYVIYTSGSTGRPRAWSTPTPAQPAAVDAGDPPARVRRRRAAEDAVRIRRVGVGVVLAADDRGDARGAAPGAHRDPRAVWERSGVAGGGAALRAVDAPGVPRRAGCPDCSSLRYVVCSGEALTGDLAEAFTAQSQALHNLYGPTEAAIDVTWWPCARSDERATVPIGRPVWNTQVTCWTRGCGR